MVQSLPPFSTVLKQALSRRHQLERQVRCVPRPIGWLSRAEGNWQVRAKSIPPGTTDLWVVAPGDERRGEWRKMGTVAGASVQILDGNNNAFLAEGRPVFVRITPPQ